jgi:hypothetical protein
MSTDYQSNHLELLTAYIDNELSNDELASVETMLETDARAQHFVSGTVAQKNRVRQACLATKASYQLRMRCLSAIGIKNKQQSFVAEKAGSKQGSNRLLWFAAAAVIVLSVVSILRLSPSSPVVPATLSSFQVEDHVFRHFNSSMPELHTAFSTSEAEKYILEAWDMNITVPELVGAVFAGFAYTEFVPDYHTPVLVYQVDGEIEPILIFAFDVPNMTGDVVLARDEQAIKTCIDHDDVHIKDIAGSHIVSWKWEQTWYAGISSHHGEVLASRLPINR